jgi:extracellular elastinolytic metalloproteinase
MRSIARRSLAAAILVLALATPAATARADAVQESVELALAHLQENAVELGVGRADVAELRVSSAYRSRHSGVTHVTVTQRHDGLEVFGASATVNVAADGEVVFVGDSLLELAADEDLSEIDEIDAVRAVESAAEALDLDEPARLRVLSGDGRTRKSVVSAGGVSGAPIPAQLGWQPTSDGLRPGWRLEIDDVDGGHLWDASVDAETGELLEITDRVSRHSLAELQSTLARTSGPATDASSAFALAAPRPPDLVDDGSSYRVFALPLESPNDGGRTLVSNPADALGSPFGWHDTDGVPGPEFTTTSGNNVTASTDRDGNNQPDPDSEPAGGPGLSFDFPLDLSENPYTHIDGSVTNAFYWVNVIHDVLYRYGFDEPAGSFQTNNYGRGGVGGDAVTMELEDVRDNSGGWGGGGNDGGSARLTGAMWLSPQPALPNAVTVASGPAQGTYLANFARFSPTPTNAGLSGEIVLVNDGSGNPSDGCSAPVGFTAGAIALADRGTCTFAQQALNAEAAGAAAVIVANTTSSATSIMAGSMNPRVGIPVVMVSQADGSAIKSGLPATGRVHRNPGARPMRDGALDASFLIHEYGHGVQSRLIGGPNQTCGEGEQGSEGGGDYLAIAMLLDPALDDPEGKRGTMPHIDHFEDSRQSDGRRPRPYSRNMSIQPFTYDSVKQQGWLEGASMQDSHHYGHGWAAVLWDMTWDLVEKHGYNPNVYGDWDTGGNNRAIQYVMDGWKFGGCNPGFVTGRDAIIAAAETLSDGEDTCTIWAAFARRGFGFSAVQGGTGRDDNKEAFDTHPNCRAEFSDGVDEQPEINDERPGSTVSLKFRVGGNLGKDILASNSPYSRQVNCDNLRTEDPEAKFITPRPVPITTDTPGNAGLTYSKGKYTYPWKTSKDWGRTCREVVVTRSDGVQHRAYFRFSPDRVVEQQWEARYDGPAAGNDNASAMAVSEDGERVFVTGSSAGTGDDFATVAYDAKTGRKRWVARYDGPAGGADNASALRISGSRVFVTGVSGRADGGTDIATVAYDAKTGKELWVARRSGPLFSFGPRPTLDVSADGSRVFVGGSNTDAGTGDDFATVAYDAKTGRERWVARYDGPAGGADNASSVRVSEGGSRVFVTGVSGRAGGGNDTATVAYDAKTGDELWVVRHDGPQFAFISGPNLGVSSTRVFVTGFSQRADGGTDIRTVAYDARTGAKLWDSRRDGPQFFFFAAGPTLDVNEDGSRVFVTGTSESADTGDDFATVAYDAKTGAERWVARYDGPATGFSPSVVRASEDGSRVIVTGGSTRPGAGSDYGTVAYDAKTGEQRWATHYDGPMSAGDNPSALHVNEDGSRVIVAGFSADVGSSDFATVAYRATGRRTD